MYIFSCTIGLLSEDQCKARDARRKAKRFVPKKEVHSPDSYGASSDMDTIPLMPQLDIKPVLLSFPSTASTSSGAGSPCSFTDESVDPMRKLTTEQREAIEKLVALQDKYEFADEEKYDEALVNWCLIYLSNKILAFDDLVYYCKLFPQKTSELIYFYNLINVIFKTDFQRYIINFNFLIVHDGLYSTITICVT